MLSPKWIKAVSAFNNPWQEFFRVKILYEDQAKPKPRETYLVFGRLVGKPRLHNNKSNLWFLNYSLLSELITAFECHWMRYFIYSLRETFYFEWYKWRHFYNKKIFRLNIPASLLFFWLRLRIGVMFLITCVCRGSIHLIKYLFSVWCSC